MSLKVSNLSLKPDAEFHLNDVSFEMSKSKIYTVIGRTLSGKTTLLKTIAGLINPDSGEMSLDGANFGAVPVWKRQVAMVYQQFINYPHLTVYDNVAFPLKQRKLPMAEIDTRVIQALAQVGLQGFENRKIQALSGGQQQRVAIARAVVANAKLILADEPTGNLDSDHGDEVMKLLAELNEAGTTIVMVTHSPHDADYARRVIHLFDGHVVTENMQEGFHV